MQGQGGKAGGNHAEPRSSNGHGHGHGHGHGGRQQAIRFTEDEEERREAEQAAASASSAAAWAAADDHGSLITRETHGSFNSDALTTNSYMDNISTTPLKSIGSAPSTTPPSVLSDSHNDNQSYVASTTETSITPTVTQPNHSRTHSHHSQSVNSPISAIPPTIIHPGDRDSESIVTLASSSRRLRRRSLDTNCSTAGIPPASIMEKVSVNPTAANSTYAVSMNDRGSVYNNERGSIYNNERGSIYNNERGSLYNNERSSINDRGSVLDTASDQTSEV